MASPSGMGFHALEELSHGIGRGVHLAQALVDERPFGVRIRWIEVAENERREGDDQGHDQNLHRDERQRSEIDVGGAQIAIG